MRNHYLTLALAATGILIFSLWAGSRPAPADPGSTTINAGSPAPTPTACLPSVPCGAGYHWDPRSCQCEPDSQPFIPANTLKVPTVTVAAATPCAPILPCGLGLYWNARLCQCLPDKPPLLAPAAGIPATPTPLPQ